MQEQAKDARVSRALSSHLCCRIISSRDGYFVLNSFQGVKFSTGYWRYYNNKTLKAAVRQFRLKYF